MISDYALRNFERYLQMVPPALRGLTDPLGAYDAAPDPRRLRERRTRGIPLTYFERGGAFDSQPRAKDEPFPAEEMPGDDRPRSDAMALMQHLARTMDADGWTELQRHLSDEDAEVNDDEDPDMSPRGENDMPPRGAKTAMDAAITSFNRMYPELASIATEPRIDPPRRAVMTTAGQKSFAKLFPDASEIKSI